MCTLDTHECADKGSTMLSPTEKANQIFVYIYYFLSDTKKIDCLVLQTVKLFGLWLIKKKESFSLLACLSDTSI